MHRDGGQPSDAKARRRARRKQRDEDAMPHAMTDAFSVDDTLTDTAQAVRAPAPARQHESETPNERAMRAAVSATKKTDPAKRQQS
jgi:hypothetical protein